ncbi:uncharacterized protein LOC113513949 isoform X3 [Galleria mellonella]|uniref:Uncharacterized protein LOC113513949 isoform X3 n=1 Tax=Galleria mellonella TaxID=7137 RepID=A0ABM3MHY4_GALME|nr:uncharacterized protein LOC113513949 isoform X3 [Galleria mellonella]
MAVKFYVYGGGRWREVRLDGRVCGWGGRSRFMCMKRGKLNVVSTPAVLRGLRALAAGRPTTVKDGLPVSQLRCDPDKKHVPEQQQQQQHTHRRAGGGAAVSASTQCVATADAAVQASLPGARAAVAYIRETVKTKSTKRLRETRSPVVEKSTRAVSPTAKRSHRKSTPTKRSHKRKRSTWSESEPSDSDFVSKRRHQSKRTVVKISSDSELTARPRQSVARYKPMEVSSTQSGSESPCYKEVTIDLEDLSVLRSFLARENVWQVDLKKFDSNDKYKMAVLFKITPLVSVEPCPQIAEMQRHPSQGVISLKEFATKLGLRRIDAESSSDSDTDKENQVVSRFNRRARRYKRSKLYNSDNGANKERLAKKGTRASSSKSRDSVVTKSRIESRKTDSPVQFKDNTQLNTDSAKKNNKKRVASDKNNAHRENASVRLQPSESAVREKRNDEQTNNDNRARILRSVKTDSKGSADIQSRILRSSKVIDVKDSVESNDSSDVQTRIPASTKIADKANGKNKNASENQVRILRNSKIFSKDSADSNVSDAQVKLVRNTKINNKANGNKTKDNQIRIRRNRKIDDRVISADSDKVSDKSDKLKEKDQDSGSSSEFQTKVPKNDKSVSSENDDSDKRKRVQSAGNKEKQSASSGSLKAKVLKKKRPVIKPRAAAAREYSTLEDHAIVAWLGGGSRARRVNGNQLWQELEPAYPRLTGVERTWHSLRNRYLRYILPGLPALALPPSHAARLRAAAHHA